METDAAEVLADLERLALAGLLKGQETERLEVALRAEHKRERDEGSKALSVISPSSAVRMSCLDALELWRRAHDARVQLEGEREHEARAHRREEQAGGTE